MGLLTCLLKYIPMKIELTPRVKPPVLLYCLTIIAAVLLAVVLNRLWSLETRYFVAVVAGIALISLSAFFIHCFSDFLLICFFFSIPLTGFSKYFFLKSLYGTNCHGNT